MVTKEQLIARFEQWTGLKCSHGVDYGMPGEVFVYSPKSVRLFSFMVHGNDEDGWQIGGIVGAGPSLWTNVIYLHEDC